MRHIDRAIFLRLDVTLPWRHDDSVNVVGGRSRVPLDSSSMLWVNAPLYRWALSSLTVFVNSVKQWSQDYDKTYASWCEFGAIYSSVQERWQTLATVYAVPKSSVLTRRLKRPVSVYDEGGQEDCPRQLLQVLQSRSSALRTYFWCSDWCAAMSADLSPTLDMVD